MRGKIEMQIVQQAQKQEEFREGNTQGSLGEQLKRQAGWFAENCIPCPSADADAVLAACSHRSGRDWQIQIAGDTYLVTVPETDSGFLKVLNFSGLKREKKASKFKKHPIQITGMQSSPDDDDY